MREQVNQVAAGTASETPSAVRGLDVRNGGLGLASPVTPGRRIFGVLFDLDGTLYNQPLLRALMAVELGASLLMSPRAARQRLEILRHYRHAQERLRGDTSVAGGVDMAETQIQMAATAAGVPRERVAPVVADWMQERPLKYLRACRAGRVEELLEWLERAGVAIGVLSDYPPEAKLRAMGLDQRFSLVLCSTDVGALKPHPRAFQHAAERWRLLPEQVLVVGDRLKVDGSGAIAAGMDAVIVGRRPERAAPPAGCLFVPSLERLLRVLEHNR